LMRTVSFRLVGWEQKAHDFGEPITMGELRRLRGRRSPRFLDAGRSAALTMAHTRDGTDGAISEIRDR
ncbi:MAG: hypothetical protein IID39_04180, partial [Planctomycetes bacterium]|nr:hypothetical protein [Planctomycetota bacterium]